MDPFNINELKNLINKKNYPAVSIYIPTFRKGPEVGQNHIRFKNQLREAEKKLTEEGIKKHDIDELMQRAAVLIDDVDFWNYQSDGLAVFISPGEFFYYKVDEPFQEKCYISDRYFLRPLFTIMSSNERFFILNLTLKDIRLFEATRYNVKEIHLKGVMTSLDEYEKTEEEDKSLQFHTETSGATNRSKTIAGARSAMFFGQGGGSDDAIYKDKILQFYNLVDTGLQKYLNTEKAPLVLAGVDYLIPIFKETFSYQYVTEKSLNFNPQELNENELRDAAWEIVKERYARSVSDALTQYGNYAGTQRASDSIQDIIKNAFSNRILYLFIDPNQQIWGKFDINTYRLEVHYNNFEAKDIDLIDLAAEQTLLHNGIVFSVDAARMPDGKQVAALYRY